MSEEVYIKRVLERFRIHYSKPIDTLVDKGLTLSLDQYPTTDDEKEKMRDDPHSDVLKSLMYVMVCTLPNICFAIGLLNRYQSNP